MSSLSTRSFGIIMLLLTLVAIAPTVAGLLLMVPAFQMMAGRPAPAFPRRIAARPLPTSHLAALVQRAVPVLRYLETMIRPRWHNPLKATRRLVGTYSIRHVSVPASCHRAADNLDGGRLTCIAPSLLDTKSNRPERLLPSWRDHCRTARIGGAAAVVLLPLAVDRSDQSFFGSTVRSSSAAPRPTAERPDWAACSGRIASCAALIASSSSRVLASNA